MPRPPLPVEQISKAAIRKRAQRATPLAGETCSRCGSANLLERHHPDYSRPTMVVILCAQCHHDGHAITRTLPPCTVCGGPIPAHRKTRNATLCGSEQCRSEFGRMNAEKRWTTERTDSGKSATESYRSRLQQHLSCLFDEQGSSL